MALNKYLDVSPEVAQALAEGRPVVALESTIISHGMPYPQNVETALAVERIIRENGAVPATIAIIGGRLKAGCSKEEIEHLGRAGTSVAKASRRDLAVLCARGQDGATTVTTTMIIAHMAGILDLGLTLEYLETHGVPVLGFGTSELPAFYTRHSGFQVDYRVDTPEELAAAFRASLELGFDGGMLVANPIPEEYSMDPAVINAAISEALAQAKANGIHGKETTPFLLAKVKELTGGDSLDSNIQLVFNNARVAAKTAACLAK